MRTRVSVAGTAGRAPPLGDHHGFTEDRTTDSSSHPIKGRPCLRRAVAVSAEQACARTFASLSRLTITSTQRPANGEVGSSRHRAAKAAPSGVTEDARESLTAAKPSVKLMHPAATSKHAGEHDSAIIAVPTGRARGGRFGCCVDRHRGPPIGIADYARTRRQAWRRCPTLRVSGRADARACVG